METGYFIHFASHYRTSWLWFLILLSFQRTIVLEGGIGHNIIMRILWLLIWAFFVYLIWPRRFMIIDKNFYITQIFSSKVIKIETKYVTAVRFGKYSFEFSYAGKHYRFLTIGKFSKILKKEFSEIALETPTDDDQKVKTTAS